MSINYSAQLVKGFRLEIHELTKGITRYREETGEPYMAIMTAGYEARVGGQVIAQSEESDDFCTGESVEGFEIMESGYDEGTKYIGVVLGRVGEYSSDFEKITEAEHSDILEAFIKKFNVKPELYLALHAG